MRYSNGEDNSGQQIFGMFCGNHIRDLIRRRTGLSRFQGITYGLWAKGCYTDTRIGKEFYTETIYTLLGTRKGDLT